MKNSHVVLTPIHLMKLTGKCYKTCLAYRIAILEKCGKVRGSILTVGDYSKVTGIKVKDIMAIIYPKTQKASFIFGKKIFNEPVCLALFLLSKYFMGVQDLIFLSIDQ